IASGPRSSSTGREAQRRPICRNAAATPVRWRRLFSRANRSWRAMVTVLVSVSPVSCASCTASRWVSAFLMFSPIVVPCGRILSHFYHYTSCNHQQHEETSVVEGQHTRNRRDSRGDHLAIAHASAWRLPTLSRRRTTDGAQAQAEGEG